MGAFSSSHIPDLPWTQGVAENFPFMGLLFVRVEAPRKMPFNGKLPPFLPYRTKAGNLVFPLCAHCAEAKQQRKCMHSTEKRSWIAAFTHFDLIHALELGYKVHEIFEVIKKIFYQYKLI